jgi:signal transduction histidine kinase
VKAPMSSVRYLNRRAPGWVRVLLAGLALCGAGYAVLLVGGGTWLGLDPDSWWPVGALGVGAALACTARAARGRRERDAWTLLAAAMASWAAGFIVWAALYEHQAAPPYPSIADALWIPFYLLMLGALASLVHAERPRVPPTAWLDALIPACAVSAVASQLLMPHVSTAGKPLAEQVVLLAYPALDVVMIVAIVLVLALRRWEPDPRSGLLAVAVLGSALGDLLWSYLVASGAHEVGSAADLPYVLTAVAIAWAAWAPKTDPLARSDDDRLTLLLPAVAASCALGLLFYGAITGDLIVPSLALALAALSAGVIRWLLAVRREAQAVALRDVAAELARKAEQQAAVADLGSRAAATSDPERVMSLAAEAVAEILRADHVAVLELAPGGIELTVRADSGGDKGAGELQQLGHAALAAEAPTVVSGAGVGARIDRKDGPWGVLALTHPRAQDLGDDDVSFVQAVANVLGAVVARAREEQLEGQLQQSRQLESVGKLAGGVAHDFNNLLAIIQGYADFALEAATDDEQRRDLEELSKAAGRGAELVNQLLAFSRRRAVDAIALDVAEIVRDMEPMLRQTVGENVELRCWLASELPATMMDASQLTQVLLNLTLNARHAMPGGGRVTIKATKVGSSVRLVVEDNGHGMDPETLSKAFDPFFTTKGPGSGTGLGLSTVFSIVDGAGGLVSIDSDPAWGTRVTVQLPSREAGPAERTLAASPG